MLITAFLQFQPEGQQEPYIKVESLSDITSDCLISIKWVNSFTYTYRSNLVVIALMEEKMSALNTLGIFPKSEILSP